MQRLGLLGGTFDPIHIAHLVLALAACEQRDLDAVVLVPANDPWQKSSVVASPEQRLTMTQLAVGSQDKLLASGVDLRREGPSYAIDTIRDLTREYPEAEFEFIVGSDALANLSTWKNYAELIQMVTFVAAERPGTPLQVPDGGKIAAISVPLLEVSSTDIRTRVQEGRSIAFLVPEAVEQYIQDTDLYQVP